MGPKNNNNKSSECNSIQDLSERGETLKKENDSMMVIKNKVATTRKINFLQLYALPLGKKKGKN